ncbi:hypothetical protein M9H77_07657 [Catharanthus roseus]|uniref:Uncharacterized protein n=1 Tax=Catharanthus roseus TaxID=4058 RepID=A0ACC0BVT4_CATRO|nr:hypothetical protein M9H77_07657 [Catharanthus roseus]
MVAFPQLTLSSVAVSGLERVRISPFYRLTSPAFNRASTSTSVPKFSATTDSILESPPSNSIAAISLLRRNDDRVAVSVTSSTVVDPPVAPKGVHAIVSFDGLSIHLFNNTTLFSIAAAMGHPLKVDEPRAALNKHSIARLDRKEAYYLKKKAAPSISNALPSTVKAMVAVPQLTKESPFYRLTSAAFNRASTSTWVPKFSATTGSILETPPSNSIAAISLMRRNDDRVALIILPVAEGPSFAVAEVTTCGNSGSSFMKATAAGCTFAGSINEATGVLKSNNDEAVGNDEWVSYIVFERSLNFSRFEALKRIVLISYDGYAAYFSSLSNEYNMKCPSVRTLKSQFSNRRINDAKDDIFLCNKMVR